MWGGGEGLGRGLKMRGGGVESGVWGEGRGGVGSSDANQTLGPRPRVLWSSILEYNVCTFCAGR